MASKQLDEYWEDEEGSMMNFPVDSLAIMAVVYAIIAAILLYFSFPVEEGDSGMSMWIGGVFVFLAVGFCFLTAVKYNVVTWRRSMARINALMGAGS